MAGIRMTGLSSGLDTEGIVKQLSEAYQTKVDNVKTFLPAAFVDKETTSLSFKVIPFTPAAALPIGLTSFS